MVICNMAIGPATRWNEMGPFPAMLSFQKHCRPWQNIISFYRKMQKCGQSATHDGMCQHSPAMFISAMVTRSI